MIRRSVATWLALACLLVTPAASFAADPLVVSVWGGNWRDTVERIVAKPFTAKTGIPVEFEVGGTLDRLAKAHVSKAAPLVDVTFTTTHVGRLYISDGLYEKLDLGKLPNSKELAREAFRSDYHIGTWAYVYTIAYRPDQREVGITTVFVTHDQHEALGLSDRVAVMNGGRIEQLGAPREVYEQPATRFVADFIGASTVLEGRALDERTVALAGGQRVEMRLPRVLALGAPVRLLVRPERIAVGGAGANTLRARIVSVMFLGDHSELRLELDGGARLLATVSGPTLFQAGDATTVTLPPEAFLEAT